MTARPLVLSLVFLTPVSAGDWPQWRGPNRDARVEGFAAPATWPKDLNSRWKVAVGDGVATPALVGDKVYAFGRQGGNEVIRCLDASTGNEVWQDKYPARSPNGPAAGFAGPRASPAVVGGKLVALGAAGTLSCLDAATGKVVWRKDDTGPLPRFFTSSSPVVVDGLCVVQLGGENAGSIAAFDLTSGAEKWKWAGDGTAYASPAVVTVDGLTAVVAVTAKNVVAVGATDGKLLWQTSFEVGGRRGYNAASPLVDGSTVIYTGSDRGTKAVKLSKQGDKLAGAELWANKDVSAQFGSPVLHGGLVFGVNAADNLFCLDARTGKTAWTEQVKGRRGYGNVVDVGPAMLSLTPSAQLVVFEPSDKEFRQLASYKVSDSESTYAYPVAAGNRVFIKDKESLTLWTVD